MSTIQVIILSFSLFLLAGCNSSPIAKSNAENLKRVQPGMRIESIKEIMGEPEQIVILPYNDKEFEFVFLSPSGYSDDFRIFISRSDSIVLRIGDGL